MNGFDTFVERIEGQTLVSESKEINDYEIYGFDFEEGEIITGEISSDLPINIPVMDSRNLGKYENEYDYYVEEEAEQVTRYSVNFEAPKTKTWNVVIENDNSRPVKMDVKLKWLG